MRRVLVAILATVLVLALAFFGWSFLQTRPAGTPQAVELAAAPLPESLAAARVLAVGESTHGTREFREAFIEVAKKASAKGFTTIAVEDNAGPVSRVNEWVQGGPGTAEEAVARFGFRLNRTREMVALVTWLRAENERRPAGERIQLYGIDVQRAHVDRDVALGWLKGADAAAAAAFEPGLASIDENTTWEKDASAAHLDVAKEFAAAVEKAAAGRTDDAALRARLSARTLVSGMERGSQGIGGYDRDFALAEHLAFLVDERAKAGSQHTVLFAHLGHVDKSGAATKAKGKKLGMLNAERWGEEYKVIATEAHVTRLLDDGATFEFTVDSPVRGMFDGTSVGFLDFGNADPENAKVLGRSLPMGSAGSPYLGWYSWVPFLHRVSVKHAEGWDALVYVQESHPAEALPA